MEEIIAMNKVTQEWTVGQPYFRNSIFTPQSDPTIISSLHNLHKKKFVLGNEDLFFFNELNFVSLVLSYLSLLLKIIE